MQEPQTTRMPTGLPTLDPILDGGVPVGSMILLFGELGAGNYEFAYSSIINTLARMAKLPASEPRFPVKIRYITFTRLESDVRHEIVQSFAADGVSEDSVNFQFVDLSDFYFDRSLVPNEWYSHSDTLTQLQKRSERSNIFMKLSEVFNSTEPESLIILDSITDIATQTNLPNLWQDLTGFLRGAQRLVKQKRCTLYLLLSKGIIDAAKEHEIADIADAVFLFRWEESTSSRRQRVMFFEKFRGVMPHLEEQDLVKFAVRISTTEGFEVSNIRMVI